MKRPDREDLRAQTEAVADARSRLADALALLALTANDAVRAARSRRGQPDLGAVSAAHNQVQRAGEALDMAAYDLATAAGADG